MTPDDQEFLQDYFARLHRAATLSDEIARGIAKMRDLWLASAKAGGKVIFIGNGGSAGISSHLAIDLAKNGGIPAVAFNDASTLTCLANDYGYEQMFRHAVRIYGGPDDTLVAISTSGASKNILNAADQAKGMGMKVVTISGKSPDNPLRQMGDVNLWVSSEAYNIVETVHQFWLMSALDLAIGKAEYSASNVTERRAA